MEFKVNIEQLADNFYKEIEIDIYEEDLKGNVVYDRTIVLEDNATLYTSDPDAGTSSRSWFLMLNDYRDRKIFQNVKYIKFMVSVYQNTDEKPYPAIGNLVYRAMR